MDKKDKNVGTGLVGAPACGDVMKLQIRVDDDGKIVEAKFKTFGCGSAIGEWVSFTSQRETYRWFLSASSSLATEWVKGKTLDQAGALKNTDIAKELCLPPVKLHCSSKFLLRRDNDRQTNIYFRLSACRGCDQSCVGWLQEEAVAQRLSWTVDNRSIDVMVVVTQGR